MAEQPIALGAFYLKLRILAHVVVSLLLVASSTSQSLRPALALTCGQNTCVYLPAVSRPPYLTIWSYVGRYTRLGWEIGAVMINTTDTAFKDIVVHVVISPSLNPNGFMSGYNITLAPNESFPFGYSGVAFSTQPVVMMQAISWTVALTRENQPLDVLAVTTRTVFAGNGDRGTEINVLVRNPLTETLSDAHIAVWAIDESGASTCKFPLCYDRESRLAVLPGELHTMTTAFSGDVPLSAIQIFAHGVISP